MDAHPHHNTKLIDRPNEPTTHRQAGRHNKMAKKKGVAGAGASASSPPQQPLSKPAAAAAFPPLGGRAGNKKDPSTLSNYEQIRSQHLKLHLNVDFGKQVLEGSAEHTMRAQADGVAAAVFDTSAGLKVTKAEVDGAWRGARLDTRLDSTRLALYVFMTYASNITSGRGSCTTSIQAWRPPSASSTPTPSSAPPWRSPCRRRSRRARPRW